MSPPPMRPKTRADWLHWLDHDTTFALERLTDQGSLVPQFIVHSNDGEITPVVIPFHDAETKALMKRFMRLLCIAKEAIGVTFIHEAWMTTMPANPGESTEELERRAQQQVPPSMSDTKAEVVLLILLYYDENGRRRSVSKIGEIIRDESGAATGTKPMSVVEDDANAGSMVDILLPERPSQALADRAKAALATLEPIFKQ